jgi:phosphatidate cytidylyltransferase
LISRAANDVLEKSPAVRMNSNLAKRVLVATIGIPALILISYFGGYWLYLFCILVSVLASWELAAMLLSKQIRLSKKLITVLPIVLVSMFQFSRFGHVGLFIVFILFMLTAVFKLIESGVADYSSHLAMSILTSVYPGFFISFAILLHRDFAPVGWVFLLFVFVNTWLADTFAYFFGRWLGKRKLAPVISPKKTWAGFIFSFVGGLITPFLAMPFLHHWSLPALMLLSLVATLFGQIGDLIESAIKRDCGVKDSSNLIPGHGGVLDRFDSFVIALPAVYFLLRIIT